MTAVHAPGRPAPRADRVRNRAKIIEAARTAFCTHGPTAPLDPIARAAGVGNATLYRHFPDRDALVRGVCLTAAERIAAQGRSALAEESDAFDAVRRFALGAAREGIGVLCLMVPEHAWLDDAELLAARQNVDDVALQAVQRAQREGRMRADVGPGDLMVVLSQLTRPLPGHVHGGRAELLLERHCRLLLAGMENSAGGELPGPPTSLSDIRH